MSKLSLIRMSILSYQIIGQNIISLLSSFFLNECAVTISSILGESTNKSSKRLPWSFRSPNSWCSKGTELWIRHLFSTLYPQICTSKTQGNNCADVNVQVVVELQPDDTSSEQIRTQNWNIPLRTNILIQILKEFELETCTCREQN